jgi:hypothetical protein
MRRLLFELRVRIVIVRFALVAISIIGVGSVLAILFSFIRVVVFRRLLSSVLILG